VIWSVLKQKVHQCPIYRFLEGPVRSVAWVDFGLGLGTGGRVCTVQRSGMFVGKNSLSTYLVQEEFTAVSVKDTGHHLGIWDLRWDAFRARLASTGGGMCAVWQISETGEQLSRKNHSRLTMTQEHWSASVILPQLLMD
jgi:hypothetical protein